MTAATDKPTHPVTQIPNIQLEDLERAIYSHNYEQATVLLLQALRRLKAGAEFIGYKPDPRLRTMLYTRMCAAIVAMLADPKMGLSPQGVDSVFAEHGIMDTLWRASAFETSDHLMPQLAKPQAAAVTPEGAPNDAQFMDGMALLKFLLTYSLRSGFGVRFAETFRRNPQQVFALWVGIVSHPLTINAQAHARREEVLGMHDMFAGIDVPQEVLSSLSDAYMYTSYSTRPDKHDAKATIHRLCARILAKHEVRLPDFSAPREFVERPTILVCIEWFTSLHAMYRCYCGLVRQLRRDFRVVALARAIAIDDVARQEFDEVYEVPAENVTIKGLAEVITNGIRPDIIWYPSLGMEMLWTVLSSVRLAPIQVMSLGHPSSSRSPAMDYVVCDDGAIGDAAVFTERVITYPNGSARFVMRPDAELPTVEREADPETVHVAVPAMLCKLNAPFLATLKEIADKARRPVQFHFFPNVLGLQLHQAAREIREWLPTALTYERNAYNAYMANLAKCHVHLSTFPFGGTNSNIDSMMLGIPIVSMWGDDPHSRFDGMMQRRADLPEWTIAKTREEYVDAALHLIHDNVVRNGLSQFLRALDIDGIFYGQAPEADRWGFAEAMWRIYRDHDLLKAREARVIEYQQ